MVPQLQTRKDGSGDCVRATISALLDLKIEQVPDFTLGEEALQVHESGYEIWFLRMQKWLAEKGYFFLEVQLNMRDWFPVPYETFAIFIGDRESEFGICRHAIVGKVEGHSFFPIFDPLGTNPLTAFKDNKIQAVCFLVPIDPALQLNMGVALDKTIRLARQLPFSEIKDTILAVTEECFGLTGIKVPLERDPHAGEPSRIITPNGFSPS